MQNLVSIIIRTLNESKHISLCLNAILNQSYKNFEIIIVDSGSTDDTIARAQSIYDCKVLASVQDEYFPGKSLNLGCKEAKGDFLIFLSAHCIPCDNEWLANLITPFLNNDKIAGVYGRQLPLPHSKPEDVRDLLITFGSEDRLQKIDSFFHNANSAISKNVWNKFPFDEMAKNIEDRIWANNVICNNYEIYYSSNSKVFHFHGIHQFGNIDRLTSTNKVIKRYSLFKTGDDKLPISLVRSIVCIPILGKLKIIDNEFLIIKTLDYLKKYDFINKIILYTNTNIPSQILDYDSRVKVVQRPDYLDNRSIDTHKVLEEFSFYCKKNKVYPDLIFYMEEVYPNRDQLDLNDITINLINSNYDAIIPSFIENRMILKKESDANLSLLNSGFTPSSLGSNLLIGSKGSLLAIFFNSIVKNIQSLEIGTIEFSSSSELFKKH
jgi:rhamnosyltransferase